jgi:hypothetical protein
MLEGKGDEARLGVYGESGEWGLRRKYELRSGSMTIVRLKQSKSRIVASVGKKKVKDKEERLFSQILNPESKLFRVK